jgi:hypothetical protein
MLENLERGVKHPEDVSRMNAVSGNSLQALYRGTIVVP